MKFSDCVLLKERFLRGGENSTNCMVNKTFCVVVVRRNLARFSLLRLRISCDCHRQNHTGNEFSSCLFIDLF